MHLEKSVQKMEKLKTFFVQEILPKNIWFVIGFITFQHENLSFEYNLSKKNIIKFSLNSTQEWMTCMMNILSWCGSTNMPEEKNTKMSCKKISSSILLKQIHIGMMVKRSSFSTDDIDFQMKRKTIRSRTLLGHLPNESVFKY